MIRKMTYKDINEVVDLYRKYMFDSFFNNFNRYFLFLIFKGIINSESGICYVYEKDTYIAGFIAAATDTNELFKAILRKDRLLFLKSIYFSLIRIRRPLSLLYLLESFTYLNKTKLTNIKAELLFITIDPRHRKKGLSKELIVSALKFLRKRSVTKVKVSTHRKNHVVNNLLKSMEFNTVCSFTFYGRKSLLYVGRV